MLQNIIHVLYTYIGTFAPYIFFFLSLSFLWTKTRYLTFFLAGFILNVLTNIFLKIVIQQPRPTQDEPVLKIAITHGKRISFDKFGMPSGHAQMAAFTFMYTLLVLQNVYLTAFYAVLMVISLYQRYVYRNHTIWQLIVGLIIGGVIGVVCYFIANQYIQNHKYKI